MEYICDLCSKRLPSKYSMQKHMLVHLAKEEREQIKSTNRCHLCTASFFTASTLAFHIRRIHERTQGIVCDICAKRYTCNASYQSHYQSAHLNIRFQCPICGEILSNTKTLNRHMQTRHDDSGPYACTDCKYTTMSSTLFKRHQKLHSPTRKRYPCPDCDKTFFRMRGLKEHMAFHTGRVLYSCEHCEYACNSAENMKKHKKRNHPSALSTSVRCSE